MGRLPQTPRTQRVIEFAIAETRSLGHNYVGTEHILLGLIREEQGVAARVLMNLGLSPESIRKEVMDVLGTGIPPETVSNGERQTVSKNREPNETPSVEVTLWLLEQFVAEFTAHKDKFMVDADYEKVAEARDVLMQVRHELERVRALLKPE